MTARRPLRVCLAISAHGYGHIAQIGPVAAELRRRLPRCELWVRCAAPHPVLAQHLPAPFVHQPVELDPGMAMADGLTVLAAASHARYRAFHRDWPRRLAAERAALAAMRPDLLLSDVAYLSLAAAASLGIRSFALCSLNWADIYAAYCGDLPGAPAVLAQIRAAYRGADAFIVPSPGLWPRWAPRVRAVGALARTAAGDRRGLRRRLGLPARTRLLALAFGGVATRWDLARWAPRQDLHWLVADQPIAGRGDMTALASTGMAFAEALLGCDVVVTKPGYGLFVEAACHGLPVLYVRRRDWPEEPWLIGWLLRHGRALEIERERLERGDLVEPLERLLGAPAVAAAKAGGATQAVDLLLA